MEETIEKPKLRSEFQGKQNIFFLILCVIGFIIVTIWILVSDISSRFLPKWALILIAVVLLAISFFNYKLQWFIGRRLRHKGIH